MKKQFFKKALAVVLAATMLSSLAACGGGAANEETTPAGGAEASGTASAETKETAEFVPVSTDPVYGGSATVLYGDDLIQYFDPAMGDNRTYALWLESLWAINWDESQAGELTTKAINYKQMDGQVAESWQEDFDANTLAVKIREDVYFQDKTAAGMGDYDIFKGRQVTAEDVAYSYRRLVGIDGVTPTPNTEMPWDFMLPKLETIEVLDDYNLVFHFENLTEVVLDTFITTSVNITGAEWDELTTDQQNDWHYAVGTGPYILTGFELSSSMDFVKSGNYYDYDERHPENKLPYLDAVRMVQIADSSNVLTQFISGNIDIISFGSDILNTSEMQQLKDSMGEGNYVEIDYYDAPIGFGLHCNQAPLDDVNVRIAIQEAIDTEKVTATLYGDTAYVNPGFWADNMGWSYEMDEELAATYKYDPEDAKARLAAAGYPDGFDLTIYSRSDQTIVTMLQMVKQYLSQVGINVTIETCTETSELNQHATNENEMCAYYSGCGGQYSVKFASMFMPGSPNYGFFNDCEEWGTLGNQLNSAATLEEQAQMARQLDQYWREGHWCIYGTGCITLHQFYSTKMGGVTGEQLCCNNNTRTMMARLWSNTGV